MIHLNVNISVPRRISGYFFLLIIPPLLLQCRSTEETTLSPPPSATPSDTGTLMDPSASARDSLKEEVSRELTEMYKEELRKEYQSRANQITNYYVQAQQYFFVADYPTALQFANRALDIQENAYLLALRGSIYLGLNQRTEFVEDWRKALEMDENVPIPESTYIIQALQSYGLIDENLKKNF